MKKQTKTAWAIIVLIILVVALILPIFTPLLRVGAAGVTQSDVDKANQTTKDLQNKINDLKKQKDNAVTDKKKMDDEIKGLEVQIGTAGTDLAAIEAQLGAKEAELAEATRKVDEKNELFKKRMRVMYENSSTTSYLEVIFTASNISDLVDRYEIIQELLEYDKHIIDDMNKAKAELASAKQAIESARAKQAQVKAQLESQKKQVNTKIAERDIAIAELEKDQKAYEKAYNEAQAKESSLKNQLSSQLSKSSGSGTPAPTGQFMWPSATKTITSPYGWRMHPTLHVNKLHTGVDIGASYGSAIFAAQDGKVVMATYNGGYGNCVVIDHGGGFSTLYGHGSQILVSAGQQVKRGQTIMQVGSTGFSTGPHLHFEIMINGSTVDPMNYFN